MKKINLSKKKSEFAKTNTKNLRIRGNVEELQSYKIPLDQLIYNKENDRIATFITEYLDEEGDLPSDVTDFNDKIERFIIKSNKKSFLKTKNNIRVIGQTEPAVVLSDGVIIDGNRRFSALRSLYRDNPMQEFGYLDAVIIDIGEYSHKELKKLELNLQHAIESKVDYNPIEKLVGIYRSLLKEGHEFTIEEYALETQINIRELRVEMETSKLLSEFLLYINQPEKFHLARNLKLAEPIREVRKILISKKIDHEYIDDIKEILFSYILTASGDISRSIRPIKSIMDNQERMLMLLMDIEDHVDDINDSLGDSDNIERLEKTGVINIPNNIISNFQDIMKNHIDDYNMDTAKMEPLEILKKSIQTFQKIESEAIPLFSEDLKIEFERELSILSKMIENVREKYYE